MVLERGWKLVLFFFVFFLKKGVCCTGDFRNFLLAEQKNDLDFRTFINSIVYLIWLLVIALHFLVVIHLKNKKMVVESEEFLPFHLFRVSIL